MLHGRTEIAGLQPKLYKPLQKMASKTTSYTHEINGLRVVQGELLNDGLRDNPPCSTASRLMSNAPENSAPQSFLSVRV